MLNLIAITNRGLAKQNYWDQVTKIASTDVDGLILREKDLDPEDYLTYAKKAQKICNSHGTFCILNHFGRVGIKLHIPRFQCSLEYLETHTSLQFFMTSLGCSVHTVEEAKKAEQLGATYIIASHVFPTPCKAKSSPIGTNTLREICNTVKVPVYALGGVTPQTIPQLKGIPIAGICAMTGLMTAPDVEEYVKEMRTAMEGL